MIRKWNASGTVENKSKSERTKVTTAYTNRIILRQVRIDRHISAPKINANLRTSHVINISNSTVQRRIKEKGYNGLLAHKNPWISKANLKKKLAWAKERATWTVDDWKKFCGLMKVSLTFWFR